MQNVPDWAQGEKFLRQEAPELKAYMDSYGPCDLQPKKVEEYFGILVTGMAAQQLPPEASRELVAKLTAVVGGTLRPENVLQTDEAVLAGCGLTALKIGYIKAFAAQVEEGSLVFQEFADLTDGQILKKLLPVRGLGQWTIELFLLLTLCRPDVLPADDYLLKKELQKVFHLSKIPKRGEALKLTAAWRPWRSLAAWYLWQHAGKK